MEPNKNGFYEKNYSVRQADGTMKRIRLRAKTEAGLYDKCLELETKINTGEVVVNRSSTFRRWMKEWIEVYKVPKVDPAYIRQIQNVMNKFFTPFIGDMPISKINLSHIQRCMNNMEGYSESYVHKAKVFITECFRKAEDIDLIYKSPCRGLEMPAATEKEERRPLTDKEIKYFLEACLSHPKGPMFTLMYACGVRPGELMALEWSSLNTKEGTLSIRQAIRANTREIKSTKTKRGKRVVPIPHWWIEDYFPLINRSDSPYVFCTEGGKPLGGAKLRQYWQSLMREMDILAGAKLYRNRIVEHALPQDIVPYCLRHTYCTQLIGKGTPIKTVQYLMGHADIRITMDIYTHMTENMIEDARKYIDA